MKNQKTKWIDERISTVHTEILYRREIPYIGIHRHKQYMQELKDELAALRNVKKLIEKGNLR